MEAVTLITIYLGNFGALFWRLSLGLHRSYWARVHKVLREQPPNDRVKHGPMTLHIPFVVELAAFVRGLLVFALHDRLNLEQRWLLLTELFPRSVRKQAEVLVFLWSTFYFLIMALDSSRTTKQMSFLNVLVIGKKEFCNQRQGLGDEDWLRFERLRRRLISFLDWLLVVAILLCWALLLLLAVHSGALAERPVLITCYLVGFFIWGGALCYPIYPLMLTIMLLARYFVVQQKALLKQLDRITRRENNLGDGKLYTWYVSYDQICVRLHGHNRDYLRSYLSLLMFVFVAPLVYLFYVIFVNFQDYTIGPILFTGPLFGNASSLFVTLLSCSCVPNVHHRVRLQLEHIYARHQQQQPSWPSNALPRQLSLHLALEHTRLRRTGFVLCHDGCVRFSIVFTFIFYASQFFFLLCM